MATGAEILGYKGQAELGYGVEGTPGGDPNALASFDRAMSSVQQQNFKWNEMRYGQKIKDRDDTLNLMNQMSVDIDVLDKDRPELENKIKEARDIWLQNPDIKSHPEAYQKLQKAVSDFKEMKAAAGTRSTEIKKMKIDYATNTDPEYRAALGAHIKSQEDAGIYHLPDPYQQKQDWDESIFAKGSPPKEMPASAPYQKDGLWYRNYTTKSDLNEYNHFYDTLLVEGANKNAPNKMSEFMTHALANEDFMSDKNLLDINNKLDAINKAEGLTEADQRFLRPIATKEGDAWKVTTNPRDFMLDVSLAKDYKLPTVVAKADKDFQKASLERAQEALQVEKKQTEKAVQRLRGAQAGAQGALAKKYLAEADKANALGDNVRLKTAQARAKGAAPVDEMRQVFNTAYNTTGFKPVSSVVPASALPTVQQATGLDENWEVAPIAASNLSAAKMLSIPNYIKNKYNGAQQPAKMLVARSKDGNINNTVLIGLDKDGKVIKMVNPNNAVGEIIKYDNGYNHNQKTVDLENASEFVIKQAQGNDKSGTDLDAINRNLGIVDGQEQLPGQAPQQAPAPVKQAPAATEAPAGEVDLSTAEIRQNGPKDFDVKVNGQWRKVIKAHKKTNKVSYK